MPSFIILHTNDIHGRIEGLARIATLIEQTKSENPDTPVLYFDAGDVEETSTRLSNLTKGVAMHRLLTAAGCDAVTAGNGGIMRYGYQILKEYKAVASYPQVLSNLQLPDNTPLPGAQSSVLLKVGELKLGLIGITANIDNTYDRFFGLRVLPALECVRELAATLHQEGANVVILLSHMGLADDRLLAAELEGNVDLIIGAHSHDLLPAGEWIGRVLIAQAGQYAQHLGRLDLSWSGEQLRVDSVAVLPVQETIPPSIKVIDEVKALEVEVERFLDGIVGELAEPLDFSTEHECGVANLMADVLRERMHAEVAILTAGQAFRGPLPAGILHRVTLWEVCTSAANPGVVTLTGAQLLAIVAKGLNLSFAAERPRAMRGLARGLLHLSGASIKEGKLMIGEQPVELEREYRVAGSDWELEQYGGYVDPVWGLKPEFEVPTILREVLEEYFAEHNSITVMMGRLGSLSENF